MNVKVEDLSTNSVKNAEALLSRVFDVLPAEHLRGFTKVVFVDLITEPRISAIQRAGLPALYHPKQGGQMAWGEVATTVLFPRKKLTERIMGRLTMRPNLAQVVFSLVAQHYYMTLSKGIKKGQLEQHCRDYTQKYFEKWRENQGGLRMKLTKPFRPTLDRWAKKLSKRYKQELDKKKG